MNLAEIFQNTNNTIGKFECTLENSRQIILNLFDKFGLLNPGKLVTSSTKGIVIKKLKNNKLKIIFTNFTPPLSVIWTKPISMGNFENAISAIIEQNKSIGFISKFGNSVQFALA